MLITQIQKLCTHEADCLSCMDAAKSTTCCHGMPYFNCCYTINASKAIPLSTLCTKYAFECASTCGHFDNHTPGCLQLQPMSWRQQLPWKLMQQLQHHCCCCCFDSILAQTALAGSCLHPVLERQSVRCGVPYQCLWGPDQPQHWLLHYSHVGYGCV